MGTLINIITILIGGSLGLVSGRRLSERLQSTIISGLGLFTIALGVKMFLESKNILIPLGAVLIGSVLGEWWQIEGALESLGTRLEARFNNGDADSTRKFLRGFLTASLLFCVGPIAILGSIQDGLSGDTSLLVIKAIMDGFAALALSASLGVGVLFSALVVLVYQGAITIFAGAVEQFMTAALMAEMNAVGGILLLGLAISSLLELRKIRTANMLPALVIGPLIAWVVERFISF